MALSGDSIVEWEREPWRDQAGCRDTDANLFFPAGNTGAAREQIRAAKAVCRSCPVTDACLRFALETNQEAGVWGGKDEDERRAMRRVWRLKRWPVRTSAIGGRRPIRGPWV